jgi:hypothetical protein
MGSRISRTNHGKEGFGVNLPRGTPAKDPIIADDKMKGITSTWTTGYMRNYQKDAFRSKLGGGSNQASLKADLPIAATRTPRNSSSKKMKMTPLSDTSSISSSAASGLSTSPFLSVSPLPSADAALVFARDGTSLYRRRCLVEDVARMVSARSPRLCHRSLILLLTSNPAAAVSV